MQNKNNSSSVRYRHSMDVLCCADRQHNPARMLCCSFVLYRHDVRCRHSQGVLCCADQQYNPALMLCCSVCAVQS